MNSSLRCFVELVLGLSAAAWAQELPLEPPRFVLNTLGPVSPVQALAFSPDSSRLYSAGADKVVHSWEFVPGRRGTVQTRLVQTLRWEIARGHRGSIYALAPSPLPNSRDLALGGVSGRDGNGDIVLYDTAAAQVRTSLRSRDAASNRDGHEQAIVALTWSPSGQTLASASINGELFVWQAPNYLPRRLRGVVSVSGTRQNQNLDRPYPLAFVTETILAAIEPVGAATSDQWRIVLYDLAGAAPVTLSQIHYGNILALARQRGGPLWASSDRYGNVYLWNGAAPNQAPRPLRKDYPAGALEFGAAGGLFALGIPGTQGSVLQMWDTNSGQVLDQTYTTRLEPNMNCLAVSPDGRWLATVGGDNGPILVYPLQDAQGAAKVKPLSSQPPLRLRGIGERMGQVAFAADGSLRLGFGPLETPAEVDAAGRIPNQYGAIRRGFDLKAGVLLPPDAVGAVAWRTPDAGAGAWQIRAEPKRAERLELHSGGKRLATITLNPDLQGKVTAYCWIAEPGQQPWAIAIGTNHQNGVYVYKTVIDGGECPLLRYFRDHTAWVTSISVSADGRSYLASASADQTIKVWNLDGIGEQPKPFARASAWGAIFQRAPQGVVLTSLRTTGIAARRGLQPGDRIVKVRVHRNIVQADPLLAQALGPALKLNEIQVPVVDPAGIFAVLERLPLWDPVELTLVRTQQPGAPPVQRQLLLVPAWEPLATLFVDVTNEWALSTPQGLYEASTAGDQMIGWQINVAPDITPRFLEADQLRKELERPDLMRRLFAESNGNLPAAVQAANYKVHGGDLTLLVSHLANDNVPQIVRMLPGDASQMGNVRPLVVQASIKYPRLPSPRGYRISALINGVRHDPVPPVRPGELPQTVSFAVDQPQLSMDVRLRVEENGGLAFADKSVAFTAAPSDGPQPRLHVLALAAAAYPNQQQRLRYSVDDAKAMLAALQKQSTELYQQPIKTKALFDQDITRQSVRQAIDSLIQDLSAASTRDLLVVFVAGHGEVVGSGYYFVPPSVNLADQAAIKESGIGWDMLEELAGLPCKKLFLLDTCNSGNVLSVTEATKPVLAPAVGGSSPTLLAKVAKPVLSPTEAKKSIRVLMENAMVLTATAANQEAFGFQKDQHGLFTKVLLGALSGDADRGADGIIDTLEAITFVRAEVPKQEAGQTPQSFPLDPFGLDRTPLTRYELAAPTIAAGK